MSAHALLLEINSRYGAPWWFLLYWLWPWALATLPHRETEPRGHPFWTRAAAQRRSGGSGASLDAGPRAL